MNFQTAAKINGTVTHEGTEYALTTIADYTSRLMPNRPYAAADEGDEYDLEIAADAIDQDGNEYRITWEFSAIKGSEPELDAYDYSAPCKVYAK